RRRLRDGSEFKAALDAPRQRAPDRERADEGIERLVALAFRQFPTREGLAHAHLGNTHLGGELREIVRTERIGDRKVNEAWPTLAGIRPRNFQAAVDRLLAGVDAGQIDRIVGLRSRRPGRPQRPRAWRAHAGEDAAALPAP